MSSPLIKYQRTIDKLPLVARVAISSFIFTSVFIIWYSGLYRDLHRVMNTTSMQIKTLKQRIPELNLQLQNIENGIKIKKEEKEKNQRNPSKLLSPHQTNEILYNLLTATDNLVLLQLTNTPPQMVFLSQSDLKIFEHGIVIKFLGDYFSTMHYLQLIEKLNWKIFWDKLEYKVSQYPTAEITLYIHTVSDYEEWIDV